MTVWAGLHPRRYLFGYAVVAVAAGGDGKPRIVDNHHAWTRGGAESMALRLNRDERRRLTAWADEHGADVEISPAPRAWSVRRMREHPAR